MRACLRAFERLYNESNGKIKLLFKLNKPKQSPNSSGVTSPLTSPSAVVTPNLEEKRPIFDSRRPSRASTLVAEKLSEAIKNTASFDARRTKRRVTRSTHCPSLKVSSTFASHDGWPDQRRIYKHPALKVVIHHGGGNSFNEADHYGLPQMVLSQWFDTHEYALLAESSALARVASLPLSWTRTTWSKP